MNFKKTAVILGILFFAVIFYVEIGNKTKNHQVLADLMSNKTEFTPYEKRGWDTYTDGRYKYSLKFPAQLNTSPIHESVDGIIKEGVGFGDPALDNYWVISVSVLGDANFLNVNEWLGKEGKKFEHQRPIVEKRITIGGSDAIVTHTQSDYELDEVTKNEKNTVFIKNGNLFEIRTRFIESSNHEKVWSSFKFNY